MCLCYCFACSESAGVGEVSGGCLWKEPQVMLMLPVSRQQLKKQGCRAATANCDHLRSLQKQVARFLTSKTDFIVWGVGLGIGILKSSQVICTWDGDPCSHGLFCLWKIPEFISGVASVAIA